MSLRKAHKFSTSVLNPKSIERTSVKLSMAVFSESTLNALKFYAIHEKKQWNQTADFIELIIKMWSVLNVKSTSKGKRKRNDNQDPVRSSLDWKLTFLREFADLLSFWMSNSDFGFSKETFLALKQASNALADCTTYLMDNLGFSFVLLRVGRLQSDSIESRFGWLRQMSGANYYLSMRQVLESDRKIRAISLLKFSAISLRDIDREATSSSCSESTSLSDDILSHVTLQFEPSASDLNII